MRMAVLLLVAAISSAACAGTSAVAPRSGATSDLTPWTMHLDRDWSYVIDSGSESCFLQYLPHQNVASSTTMAPVDCAKLAQNVPEAREVITWEVADEATGFGDEP